MTIDLKTPVALGRGRAKMSETIHSIWIAPYGPLSMAPKMPIDARPPEDQSGHSVRIMLEIFSVEKFHII